MFVTCTGMPCLFLRYALPASKPEVLSFNQSRFIGCIKRSSCQAGVAERFRRRAAERMTTAMSTPAVWHPIQWCAEMGSIPIPGSTTSSMEPRNSLHRCKMSLQWRKILITFLAFPTISQKEGSQVEKKQHHSTFDIHSPFRRSREVWTS